MNNTKQIFGFIGASLSLLLLFSASASPIPLYGHYAQILSIDKSELAMTAVMYFAGTVISLVFFARLSNYWGRKITIYLILILGIIGCTLFIFISSSFMLMFARFIQGISCGMASSTVTAYLIDTEPKNSGLGTAFSSGGSNLGLSIGAIGTGLFVQFGGVSSLNFSFELISVLLLMCILLISLGRESISLKKGIVRSLKPQIKVPKNIQDMLLPLACTVVAGWSVGGFYQSYSATICTQIFAIENTTIISLVFISLIAPIAFGAVLAKQINPFKAQSYGMLGYVIGLALIYLSLFSGNIILFCLVNIITGIMEGIMFTGSMRTILDLVCIEDRAGVLSLIYIISYLGAVIPNLVVSEVAYMFDLKELILGFAILGFICYLILLLDRYIKTRIVKITA